MSRIRCAWFLVLALAVTLGAAILAQTQKSPQQAEVLFESARQKEVVEGKLQEAIQLYQRIVQDFAANRPVAAKALLRMGQCYERLGQADARKAYERLVREFGDQADIAAEARARLSALAGPPAARKSELAARQVWIGADLTGSPSSDGRSMATTDWGTGDIAIRDLATGDMRRVTKTGDIMKSTVFGYYAKFSPDDRQIAYAWLSQPGNDRKNQRFDLWLVGADGTGARQLYREENAGVTLPFCWTPDGKTIAAIAYMTRTDNSSQIVLVSAERGAVRVLKSASRDQPQPSTVSVSPDGRFLVYDAALADGKHDIFAISLQDGRETRLVEHPADDRGPIWTPDGKRVLFISDRTGSAGLWAQEVADGNAVGQPELVRPDTGRISPMGFTKDGAMYYGLSSAVSEVFVATLDVKTGRLLDKPSPVSQRIVAGRTLASWSPDGRHLAYLTRREPAPSGSTITIRTIDSGEERDIRVDISPVRQLGWFPDGTALVVPGLDANRKPTVFRVDVKSGAVSTIVQRDDMPIRDASVTRDGKSLVYFGYAKDANLILVRDLQTGAETPMTQPADPVGMAVSPDGRLLAVNTSHEATKRSTIVVVPITGGVPREIYRVDEANAIPRYPVWTPDGSRVLCALRLQNKVEFVLVPVDGGEPVKMPAPMNGMTALSFHPDGKRVAFAAGQSRSEVWVMENFLPAPKR